MPSSVHRPLAASTAFLRFKQRSHELRAIRSVNGSEMRVACQWLCSILCEFLRQNPGISNQACIVCFSDPLSWPPLAVCCTYYRRAAINAYIHRKVQHSDLSRGHLQALYDAHYQPTAHMHSYATLNLRYRDQNKLEQHRLVSVEC